jgi:hypothetical protein
MMTPGGSVFVAGRTPGPWIVTRVDLTTLSRTGRQQPQRPPGRLRAGLPAWPASDSLCWPGLAAAVFTAAQLAFVAPHLGLGWDETVYVSQVTAHAPAAYFDPARARGIPLLVAPVTLLTSSVTALRAYLAIASGLALFGTLLTWRRLRPAWQLAVAGVIFGGLWTAQYYGPQAMPDLWVALSGLAAVGLFLQSVQRRARAAPGGIAAAVAIAALVRPGDAVFLAAPLLLAMAIVPAWRQWRLAAAVAGGLAAGSGEWVVEAYVRFGGPLARLHQAGAEQGGFGLHPGIWDELRALNGPTLCRPCTAGWRQPELSLWWLILPVLVALGVIAARRAGRLGSAALPAACGCCAAVQYLGLINYAAPRFLLPAYALLAVPVTDALGWMMTGARGRLRPLTTALVVGGLALQLATQQLVLQHEVAGTVAFHDDYARIAADLARLGIRPPCRVTGEQDIPIAFYAGCGSAGSPPLLAGPGPGGPGLGGPGLGDSGPAGGGPGRSRLAGPDRVAVLAYPGARRPRYTLRWRRHGLPGTHVLKLVAYVPR